MILLYLLAFSRVVTGLVFGLSLLGKLRRPSAFVTTIQSFRLLPPRLSRLAAGVCWVAEAGVVGCMGVGGPLLLPGLLGAVSLLLLFSAALASVLRRQIATSCSCFGPTVQPMAPLDLGRNAGFLACALAGLAAGLGPPPPPAALGLAGWGVASAASVVFVVTWLHLRELLHLVQAG